VLNVCEIICYLLVCFLCKIFVWLEQKEREVKEKSDAVGEGVKRKRELKLSRRNERNERGKTLRNVDFYVFSIYISQISNCVRVY